MSEEEKALVPWRKQPGESRQAYAAFRIFKEQNPGTRGYPKVASECTKSLTLIKRWASRWDWQERADAWDAEQERLDAQEMNRQRREMVEKHLKMVHGAQSKAIRALNDLSPEQLVGSPALLKEFLDWTMRAERLLLGEPEAIEERREVAAVKVDVVEKLQRYAPVIQGMIERGVLSASQNGSGG